MTGSSGIEVRPARHGRGVFATRRFEAGEVVERCPTIELPDAGVTGLLRDYVFSSVNDGNVVLVLGYGMLYNHSSDANLEYEQDDATTVEFHASRAIEPGEELTIDYQGEWWGSRGREPDPD
jgi:uncharacterized protein